MILSLLLLLLGVLLWAAWVTERASELRFSRLRARYFKEPAAEKTSRFKGVTSKLTLLSFSKRDVEERIVKAGFYEVSWARYYSWIKAALLLPLLVGVFMLPLSTGPRILVMAMTVMAVIVLPDMFLAYRSKQILRLVSANLPYLLDMLAMCVKTGLTIEASLEYLADELGDFDHHLSHHLKRTAQIAKVKNTEFALNALQRRLPSTEIASFVSTLLQNLQYGSAIAPTLQELAQDIRQLQVLDIEERVGKLAAKMSVPLIVFILMPVVILIIAPGLMRLQAGG